MFLCVLLQCMINGHTKFSTDACFGFVKRKFHQTNVSSLNDLPHVVNDFVACNIVSWLVPMMVVPLCLPVNGLVFLPPILAA